MNFPSKTYTVSEAKKRLLKLVEDIDRLREKILITKNGIPTTIMMSIDDYDALIETMEILADPGVMRSLRKSKQQVEKGRLIDDAKVWE